ncbi:carbohydrate porin [Gluconacetobacter sacchari]|uniref:Carbohydrate porin n=2 Tax=Gluconacetobacter sacchari TaxID=92759 RepID=A0A7W4IBG3_9PROT|nr:carbohydrate porin [Gluconacetobacter sacchari]MBB2159804.1 carbohydrate porin [Gluconacetobacter sacchari]
MTFLVFLFVFSIPVFGERACAQAVPTSAFDDNPRELANLEFNYQPTALFMDPSRFRTWLKNWGLAPSIDTENEFGGNVGGGITRSVDNTGQMGWGLDVDWAKLAGIRGLSTHFVSVTRYGTSAAWGFGDTLNPSQQVYGGGGNVAFHMALFYFEQKAFHDRLDVFLGRIGLLNNFDASPLNCQFINNTLCGIPKTPTDISINSSYPKAVWGLRASYALMSSLLINTGVYADVRANNLSGWNWTLAETPGVGVPAELEYHTSFGAQHLNGRVKLGMSYQTATVPDVLRDAQNDVFVTSGRPPRQDHPYPDSWFVYDQMLLRNAPGDDQGLMLMLRFNHNDPNIARRAEQYVIGFVDNHFWKSRPKDSFGVIFSATSISGKWGRAQGAALAAGLRPPLGYKDQIHPGIPYQVQRFAQVVEATYHFDVGHGILVAPDVQYFVHPNAQRNIPNATFLGLRVHVQIF